MDTSLQQQLKNSGYVGEFNLSSLIEACGVRFDMLQMNQLDEWIALGGGGWVGKGSTPEESVANLWLELNEK